jgi:outer membrane receptor for ferrienterochelin and colicins
VRHHNLLALGACLLLSATAVAQPSQRIIIGHIVDEATHEPLSGASVRLLRVDSTVLVPTNTGAVAGADGTFRIVVADTGRVGLEITMLGYGTHRLEVTSAEPLDIHLAQQAHESDGVVVRAARRTRSVEDACCRVESIREEVQQHAPFSPTAVDVLRRYSSCTSTRISCALDGSQSVRLRGLEPTYISVLVDGLPAISGLGTFYGLGLIPSHALQTIRISEGASSAAAGNGAVSGVVDLQTRVPTEETEIVASGNLAGELTPEERDVNLSATGMLGDYGYALFASLNNHRRDDGLVPGEYDRISALLKLNRMIGDATEVTWSALAGGDNRVGRSPYLGEYEERVAQRRVDLSMGVAHTFDDESELTLRTLGSFTDIDGSYGTSWLDATQRILYASAVHLREIGDHTLIVGLEGRDDRLRADGAPIDYTSSVVSGYVQDELYLSDEWALLGSLRYDQHSTAGGIVSPRASIRFEPEANTTMRLMAGSGFKAQAHFDEEEHRALHGGYRWSRNDAFRPERSFTVNYDVSHSFMIGESFGVDANFNAYHTMITGKAVPALDSAALGVLYMVNSGEPARLRGIEVQLRPSFGTHWSGSLAFSLIDYTMRGPDGVYRSMPLASPLSIDASLMYHDDESGLTVESWASHIGAVQLDHVGEFNSDPYTLVNLRVERSFGPVSLYVGVLNLLDAQQDGRFVFGQENAYHADGIWGPLEGREAFAGATFRTTLQ